MRWNDILKLSIYNIIKKKYSYTKVFVSFIFIFITLFSTILYSNGISNQYYHFANNEMSANRIIIQEKITKNDMMEIKEMDNVLEVISKTNHATINPFKDFTISIDANDYILTNMTYKNITIIDRESKTVNSNYQRALRNKFNAEVIKYGKDIAKADEIIINEAIFNEIGIYNIDTLIGKEVAIHNDSNFILSKKLVGITDKHILELSGFSYEMFIIKDDIIDYKNVIHDISLSDFFKSEETISILTDRFNSVIYLGNAELESITMLLGQRNFIANFLSMICGVIIFVFLFSTINNQYYLFKKNAAYYGILKTQGLLKTTLFLILFFEILLISLLAEIISFIVAMVLLEIVKNIFYQIFNINLVVTIFNCVMSIGICSLFLVLLTSIISCFIYFTIIRKAPVVLLKQYY